MTATETEAAPDRWPLLRQALAGWVPAALLLLGLAFGAFDAFIERPALVVFARTGRRVQGTVLASSGRVKSVVPKRGRWVVSVQDPELGWQLVDADGNVPEGGRVELLCSTSAGRCERLARVTAYVERWPLTMAMGRAATFVLLGGVLALVTRSASPRG